MQKMYVTMLMVLFSVALSSAGFAALPESPAVVQFYVETLSVIPGDTVVLALQIAEPIDLYYAGFEVGFDPGIFFLLDVQPSGIVLPGLSVTELLYNDRVGAAVSRTSKLPEPQSGSLARVRFVVKPGAIPQTSSFQLFNLEMANSDGHSIAVSLPAPISVAVVEPEPVIDLIPSAFNLAVWDLEGDLWPAKSQFVNRDASLELFGASLTGFASGYVGQAANSNSWMGGSNGSGFWQVAVSTIGFRDITVSSRQFGSGSGPRDFILYGSINGSEWIALTPDTIRLSSTSWNVGHVADLPLLAVFENQPSIILRWMMASESRIDTGAPISSSTGTSRMDNITILGYQLDPTYTSVWPGDTNNDGQVNADDVLPLGIHWLHHGPIPFIPSNAFAARAVEHWVPTVATFADTNGDGLVDYRDLQWIGMHFGSSRAEKVVPEKIDMNTTGSSPIATLVLDTPLKSGAEHRIRLHDSSLTDITGAAWRLRVRDHDEQSVSVLQSIMPSNGIAFLTTAEEGVTEGAFVFKNGAYFGESALPVELLVHINKDIDRPITLELERFTVVDHTGSMFSSKNPSLDRMDVVSIGEWEEIDLPDQVKLEGNYPNPFNPSTSIRFSIPESMSVRVEVFDINGRLVVVPASGMWSAGRHEVYFNASALASGVYTYRIVAGGNTLYGKMLLLK